MNTHAAAIDRHFGPPLLIPALLYLALFVGSLVCAMGLAQGFFPTPWNTLQEKVAYFAANATTTRVMAFLQFGAAIPLAVFTATVTSRIRFFGSRAAGPSIALAGGLLASFSLAASAAMEWMLARPGTLESPQLVSAFYDLAFLLGGPIHMAGLGLLLLGVSVSAFFMRLIPRWICILGIVVAVVAEISTVTLLTFNASFLLPARFPAFVWMIAVAVTLPAWKLKGSMES